MEIKRVGRREFLINTHKYLEPGMMVLTNRGRDEFTLTIEKASSVKPVQFATYSCGCKREVFFMCPKCGVK
jgi:hypothetical protein